MSQLYAALGVLDSWVLIIYLVVIIGLGFIFAHIKVKNTKDFVSAGQNLGLLVIVGSTCATYFGGYTASGGLEVMHQYGMTGFMFMFACNVGWMVLAFMGKKLRRSGAETYPQYISMRYGEETRLASSAISIIYLIGQTAGQFVACGTIAAMLGICSFSHGILFGGIIIILLTVSGGLVSVAWTGTIQQIFITILCVFLVPITAFTQAGGVAETFAFNGPIRSSLVAGMPADYLIGMCISLGLCFAAEPAYAQRIFVAKDENTAARGALISNILCLIMTFILFSSVLALYKLSPETPGSAFVPFIVKSYFPPVVKGLSVAAFVSILITSADTLLMANSSIFTTDLWPLISPKSSEKTALTVSRIFIVVMGVVAICIGIYFQSVYTVMLLFAGAYGSSVFPSILFAVITDGSKHKNPINRKVVPYAMVITFVVTAIMDLVPTFPTEGVFIGLPLNILILLIGSKIIESKEVAVTEG